MSEMPRILFYVPCVIRDREQICENGAKSRLTFLGGVTQDFRGAISAAGAHDAAAGVAGGAD